MRVVLIFALISLVMPCPAQQPALYFRNLTVANGLSSNKVNCVIQDRRGFIWIGTEDGLNRYDGNRFQVFHNDPDDSTSVGGNIITDLLEDKDGLLWISTADGGLSRYDYRQPPSAQFRQYRHRATDTTSIPTNYLNALVEDSRGNLWLATSGNGVLRFEKSSEKFTEPIRRRGRTCLDLVIDPDGKIWAGRVGGGILKIDPVSLQYEEDEKYNNVYAKLPHMVVASLYRDNDDKIWMGSWDKVVYRVEPSTMKEEVFAPGSSAYSFPGDDPLCFAQDKSGKMWIGGKYNGLYVYDPRTSRFFHFSHDPAKEGSLSHNQVNGITIDRSGVVWIGTNHGLSMHDPAQQQFVQTFLPYNDQRPGAIYDFFEDARGNLLIGSNTGVYYHDRALGTTVYHPLKYKSEPLAATKFYRDEEGQFFLGTNVSLYKMDPVSYALQQLPNTNREVVINRIIESRIVSMLMDTIDNHPALIVAPYGHYIAYYDFTLQQWVSRTDSVRQILKRFNIRDNLIRKLYRTRNGQLWVATSKMGLGKWQRHPASGITYFNNNPGQPGTIGNNHIYDLIEDVRGNLWVSTYGGGLHYFDVNTNRFQHISASDNLTEGLQLDNNGNVWIIANGNLHKYDPRRKTYSTYQLPDLEKTGGVKGYIFKDSGGMMYVAGSNYYIAFDPSRIREVTRQPEVYFTDFRIFNTSNSQLLFEKEIVLKHDQNYFSLEFSAPGYESGYPVQYSHRLVGVDPDWVEDGTLNSVNYTNLDGGEYEFKVRATVRPGVWSNEVSSIRIRIIPPFWKSWWFYVCCALLIALLTYAVYRYRIKEILKRQAIRNKIAQDLHDNVGSTLSSISVYSQVAKIYKQQEKSQPLQEALEKISSTSSEMISEMNDIVWAINPRNDNMATIFSRMESFARPLLASREIKFDFIYDESLKQLHLEMTKRKNFYLIFKEAINNALKYSECRQIKVKVELHHHQLILSVKDDGRGFDTANLKQANSLSGNGLQNMRMRTREMKGNYVLESSPGGGTTIRIQFPIP